MNFKMIVKIGVDIAMTVALLLLMAYQLVGDEAHAGIGIIIMRIYAVLSALYGGFAFIKRDIWNYMTLKNHFAFFDFSEHVIFFLLDYLAVMGLFVFIGHYLSKGLLKLDRSLLR